MSKATKYDEVQWQIGYEYSNPPMPHFIGNSDTVDLDRWDDEMEDHEPDTECMAIVFDESLVEPIKKLLHSKADQMRHVYMCDNVDVFAYEVRVEPPEEHRKDYDEGL